jgi:hypothetical protein
MTFTSQPFDATHAVKCELAADVLRSSGKLRLRVTGWSMLPSIWPGDTLIIERTESLAVSEGDIVLFARNRRLFAHRVVTGAVADALTADAPAIVTRGDAMRQPDLPITDRDLLGKVVMIERNGRALEPKRNLRFPARAVASLVQHSDTAARVVVRVHDFANSQVQTS